MDEARSLSLPSFHRVMKDVISLSLFGSGKGLHSRYLGSRGFTLALEA
jgi:hypothetical protein